MINAIVDHDIIIGRGGFGNRTQHERQSPDSDISIEKASNCVLIRRVVIHKGDGFFFLHNVSNLRL
jgi:hypothetical protein